VSTSAEAVPDPKLVALITDVPTGVCEEPAQFQLDCNLLLKFPFLLAPYSIRTC
jgi:hypothetical protein